MVTLDKLTQSIVNEIPLSIEKMEDWDDARMGELDATISRLRSKPHPSLSVMDEIDTLEAQWVARLVNEDRRYSILSAGGDILCLCEQEFYRSLSRKHEDTVVGIASSKTDCVMHRWIRRMTGLQRASLNVEIDYVMLYDGIDQFTVALPRWAAQISRITTFPQSDRAIPITAGWLRRAIMSK